MDYRLLAMNLPRYPLLGDAETRVLLEKARAGDAVARERLVQCNLRLVFNLVQRFQNRGHDPEDLFQIGCIGLMKAIDKFDPQLNVKFSTYAVPMIVGEIRRFLRDDGQIKVSRSLKEMAWRVGRAREHLMGQLGREPSVGEVAEAVGCSREEVVAAMEVSQGITSIYESTYQDDGEPIYLLDQLRGEEEQADWLAERLSLEDLLATLPGREQQILRWRFFEDRTQADVARRLGLSQVQVSRLERQALKRLRETINQ
ncbi:MAG: RNA polymerase sporulation sigma factor SigF [Desulfotomaculales bacterium]